jgi:hypothetical protein
LPTELPKPLGKALGGSEPLKGESEADYVSRQKALQEDARERLRQKFGSNSNNGGKARYVLGHIRTL